MAAGSEPAGAPRANASIHECVTQAAQADQSMIDRWIPAGPDPYVRQQAIRTEFVDSRGTRVTSIGVPRDAQQGDPDARWWVQDPVVPDGPWLDFDPNPFAWTRDDSNDLNIDVLVLFEVDAQGTGFDIVSLWPDDIPITGVQFGVVQSCLCSVDPGIAPWCA